MPLFAKYSVESLVSLGKLESEVMWLLVKSMVSNASRVTDKCSMVGMASDRRDISRAERGLVCWGAEVARDVSY